MIEPGKIEHNVPSFPVSRFLLDLQPTSTVVLPPNPGSALHGGFGAALKSLVCVVKDTPCPACSLYRQCAYPYLFETPPPLAASRMPKAQAIPRPYVLEPLAEGKRLYHVGDSFQVGVVLIGKAIAYLPYFLEAFKLLGHRGIGPSRGRFSVTQVSRYDAAEGLATAAVVPEGTTQTSEFSSSSAAMSPGTSRITLRFLTPTRIEREGQPVRRLDFAAFFDSLLRRLRNLQFFHHDPPDCEGDQRLQELSHTIAVESDRLVWMDQERVARGRWVPQGGLVGELGFKGELSPFLPFLRWGEFVHVGKGTTFGMGRYKMVRNKGELDV